MTRPAVRQRVLRPGSRVLALGAELVNLKQPCAPLEAPTFENAFDSGIDVPYLKLNLNSTRRTTKASPLGFHPEVKTLPTAFSSLLSGGGMASEIRLQIVRAYPVVYKGVSEFNSSRFINEKVHDRLSLKLIRTTFHKKVLARIALINQGTT